MVHGFRLVMLSICFLIANSSFAAIAINTLNCENDSKTVILESVRTADGQCFFPIDQWTIDGESFLEPIAYCAEFAPEVIAGGYTSHLVKSKFDLDTYSYAGYNETEGGSKLSYTINVQVRHGKSGNLLFAGKLNCSLAR